MVRVIFNEHVIDVVLARSFFSRLKGFLGKKPKPGDGLLLKPCKQVHTLFMKAPIDVYYLDKEGTVLAAFRSVKPWRVLPFVFHASMVLELGANTLPIIRKQEKFIIE